MLRKTQWAAPSLLAFLAAALTAVELHSWQPLQEPPPPAEPAPKCLEITAEWPGTPPSTIVAGDPLTEQEKCAIKAAAALAPQFQQPVGAGEKTLAQKIQELCEAGCICTINAEASGGDKDGLAVNGGTSASEAGVPGPNGSTVKTRNKGSVLVNKTKIPKEVPASKVNTSTTPPTGEIGKKSPTEPVIAEVFLFEGKWYAKTLLAQTAIIIAHELAHVADVTDDPPSANGQDCVDELAALDAEFPMWCTLAENSAANSTDRFFYCRQIERLNKYRCDACCQAPLACTACPNSSPPCGTVWEETKVRPGKSSREQGSTMTIRPLEQLFEISYHDSPLRPDTTIVVDFAAEGLIAFTPIASTSATFEKFYVVGRDEVTSGLQLVRVDVNAHSTTIRAVQSKLVSAFLGTPLDIGDSSSNSVVVLDGLTQGLYTWREGLPELITFALPADFPFLTDAEGLVVQRDRRFGGFIAWTFDTGANFDTAFMEIHKAAAIRDIDANGTPD